jgi:hypothetical protein
MLPELASSQSSKPAQIDHRLFPGLASMDGA